jgi:hypothetical protein
MDDHVFSKLLARWRLLWVNIDANLDNVSEWSGNPVSAVQFNNPSNFKVVRGLDVYP